MPGLKRAGPAGAHEPGQGSAGPANRAAKFCFRSYDRKISFPISGVVKRGHWAARRCDVEPSRLHSLTPCSRSGRFSPSHRGFRSCCATFNRDIGSFGLLESRSRASCCQLRSGRNRPRGRLGAVRRGRRLVDGLGPDRRPERVLAKHFLLAVSGRSVCRSRAQPACAARDLDEQQLSGDLSTPAGNSPASFPLRMTAATRARRGSSRL